MSQIPLPERGQPIDVAYLYQIANGINQLSNQVSSATYNYATIDTVSGGGPQSIKTSEMRVVGGSITVANASTVSAATTKSFSYQFAGDFKYTPIVTATPINTGKTAAGENVTVVITDVTRSSVDGIVRFNSSGDLSVIVNLIIIGIPN
jgi:hypothetical protein